MSASGPPTWERFIILIRVLSLSLLPFTGEYINKNQTHPLIIADAQKTPQPFHNPFLEAVKSRGGKPILRQVDAKQIALEWSKFY